MDGSPLDLMQKPTLMIPPLTAGKQTTLTCTAPGLCSGSVPQITWTWRGEGENDTHITGNVTAVRNESVTSVALRYSSTLTFDPSAEHHGTSVTCKVGFRNNITAEETVTLNVTYVKDMKITGNTSVKEGETLNLNCSVESFPPSLVTWTKFSDKNMQNRTKNNLQNDTFTDPQNDTKTYPQEEKTGVVTYSVSNVTAEDSGRYICTAKYLNNTLKERVDIDDDEAVEDDQTYYQEAAEEEEVGGGGGAVAAEKAALNLDDGPKDVEYASIDFSMLKRKSNREAAKTQETTETEYAEIKKVKEEREDNGREEGEVEEEAMMAEEAEEEEEEIRHDLPIEEEGEDMEVYSNVKDIMSEI
ncbi:Sialic acid-binding [Collichthys lucidus]|uniref:Sialic acid-binding n=1 Tax=Collichthys lucidus TaxID=240159 RepID=A0A4U5V4G9_COLLU|nr:Sialic acid-binding [Collichthys lucidus]